MKSMLFIDNTIQAGALSEFSHDLRRSSANTGKL